MADDPNRKDVAESADDYEELDDGFGWDDDDEEAWLDMMCGLRPDGQCSMAGSEFCDWSCGRLG